MTYKFKIDDTLRSLLKEGTLDQEFEIIRKAKSNPQDFDVLYQKYYPMINNFVFHRIYDEATRYEIVSNTFYIALKKIDKFRFLSSRSCSFSSWLYRIAVNEVNQYYRKQKRDIELQRRVVVNTFPDEESMTREVDYNIIKEKLTHLSIEEQTLISLRFFEKLSYKQIKEITKKKEGTLKVKVHRALNKLRGLVEGEVK